VKGERSISTDTALRLSFYFENTAEFWINLQSQYDLRMARKKSSKLIEIKVKPLRKTTQNKIVKAA
jgi:plasmid maintenance system antidote protein VapI